MDAQSPSRVSQLASIISANVTQYEEWHASQGIPSPSFTMDVPVKVALPDHIAQARQTVIESTAELNALMLGPIASLEQQMREHNILVAFHVIYRFNIATSFPVGGEASYKQISQVCGLDEVNLRRILRFAIARRVFCEPRKGFVAHTATSKVLAEMPVVREYVGMVCEELWPSAVRTVDALVKWPESQEPNHTGFALANNTADPMFTELSRFPARSERFRRTMDSMSNQEGFEPEQLFEAFPWESMNPQLFVDVGGSLGKFSILLARRLKQLRCIVQDLPDVVAQGASVLPTDVADQVEFMAHDFFSEQVVKGADIYFLRWILHDWSDKYCIKILQALIPALKDGSRIIIGEWVVPEPGVVSPYQEWIIRCMDLSMLQLFNSREREPEDWTNLFNLADKRFAVVDIKRPPSSKLSFVEVIWKE